MVDIASTYGAILFGASVAFGYVVMRYSMGILSSMYSANRLSGIVGVQCVVYFKLYPDDLYMTKALVRALHVFYC
jgi:hypothetical protein